MSEITCDKCGHQWLARTPNPIKCPNCQHFRRKQVPTTLRFNVLVRDRFTCTDCGFESLQGAGLDTHHVIPQSQNGPDTLGNLVTLCRRCHNDRHKKPKTKFHKSKTYSLSDEVVAAIEAARARGLTPNKYLRALIALAAATDNGEFTTLNTIMDRLDRGVYRKHLSAEETNVDRLVVEPSIETQRIRAARQSAGELNRTPRGPRQKGDKRG